MGISQHTTGTDNARCLIALCAITGNIGRPGTGLHPLRGQNNVQGASDMGLIPMFYPDYQTVTSDQVRQSFESAWGRELDPKRGLTVTEIVAAALHGEVRGMYMMGENPFLSDPNINKVRKALAQLDFLVVQDIFLTETCEFADVILPATTMLEKDGTYTNTDRRVQLGRKVLTPPGQARQDWEIIQEMSNRIGLEMRYTSPSEVFDEIASLTPSYGTLSHANLGASGKLYPNPDPEHSDGTVVMFETEFATNDGLAHLVPAEWMPAKELPDAEYPFVLNTGRLLEHWHTGSMTRRSFALDAISPRAQVFLHAKDAARLGVAEGDFVKVSSRRGSIEIEARISHRETPGSCFIPFHFREAAANLLTIDEVDPFGKIPEFKFCAVRVERAAPRGRGPGVSTSLNGAAPGREARAGRFPGPSLIPALTAIQHEHGWLPREELVALSRATHRPLYEIEGLVSFYPHFRTEAAPAVAVSMCHDLSCWLKGADSSIAAIRARYGEDADIELEEVSCLGRCEQAPVVAVNEVPAEAGRLANLVEAARAGTLAPATAPAPARALAERPLRTRATSVMGCSGGRFAASSPPATSSPS